MSFSLFQLIVIFVISVFGVGLAPVDDCFKEGAVMIIFSLLFVNGIVLAARRKTKNIKDTLNGFLCFFLCLMYATGIQTGEINVSIIPKSIYAFPAYIVIMTSLIASIYFLSFIFVYINEEFEKTMDSPML